MDQDKKIDTLIETVESLAIIMKEGFDRTSTKEDLQNLTARVDVIGEGLDIVKIDVREIKESLQKVKDTSDTHTEEIDDFRVRINKLEDKVFVA